MVRWPAAGLALLLCVLQAAPAEVLVAQEPPAPPAEQAEQVTVEALTRRRQELRQRLADIKQTQPASEEAAQRTQQYVDALERTILILDQQEASLTRAAELKQALKQADDELARQRTTGVEDRDASFLTLEAARGELMASQERADTLATARRVHEQTLEEAKREAADKERARRQAKETLESNKDEAAATELSAKLTLAEALASMARENLRLRELEHNNQQLVEAVHQAQLTLLTEQVAGLEQTARFTRQDLERIYEKIDKKEFDAKRALDLVRLELDAASRLLTDARLRRDRAPQADPVLTEEVEAARRTNEARNLKVVLLGGYLERRVLARTAWTRRYELFNEQATRQQMLEWQKNAEDVINQLRLTYRLQVANQTELRKVLSGLQQKLETARSASPESSRWLEDQITQVQKQLETYEEHIADLEATQTLYEQLLGEILVHTASVTWQQRVESIWEGTKAVWNYEISSVDDKPITVRKIVLGLILLLLGFLGSRRLSAVFGGRILPRLGVNHSAAAALQSITFYLLIVGFSLFALHFVNVPLTAFTVLGGALAIGVGFGSQNIVNNFISGLIILAERPVRVGDFITVGDLSGTVHRIGPRSTRVRSSENVDIIVPNSSFLEQKVVNWTLSDDQFRAHVVVGVIYGSPTREVTRLIRKAVDEHGKVLKKPEPIILFSDFGDNALIFEVHFWIRMRRLMDRRIIESDIRFRIDTLFREAGLVIAFPQRDVHLDSVRPLQIQMLPAEPSGASPKLPPAPDRDAGDAKTSPPTAE